MALRNRRLIGLGMGLLCCASVGCTTTKEDTKPITNQVSKSTMGPGNTVMSPQEPLSPAYNNLSGNGPIVMRNLNPANPYSSYPPVAPNAPVNANPNYVAQLSQQQNPLTNQANFNMPAAAPTASVNNYDTRPLYPPQQPMGGQLATLPQLGAPAAPQPQPAQPMSPPMTSGFSGQMPGIQMPPLASSQPAQVPLYNQQPFVASPAQQNDANPQMQPPTAPQQNFNQGPSFQAQPPLPSPPAFTPQPPVRPAVPLNLPQPPQFGTPMLPGPQSMLPSPAPNAGVSTPSSSLTAAAALESTSSTAPSVKTVAGNMRGISDPMMNLPQEPVEAAPTTIISVPQ